MFKKNILLVFCFCLNLAQAQEFISKVPHARTIQWSSNTDFNNQVISNWANKSFPINALNGKGNVPRIMLAKLFIGRDVPEVNSTILKLYPWGVSGTSWAGNKKGDYDFTITPLTTILYLFGDKEDILWRDAKEHLLNKLLIEDGNAFRTKAPHTWNLIPETENHILMTEGSRYLKNRWIMLHGNKNPYYNNISNGMEEKMIGFLNNLQKKGLFEYNSNPYLAYTITALLNLEAFASDEIRAKARDVLDYINWCYALGSFNGKHFPPMRRRYEKEGIKDLETDYHSAMIQSWMSFKNDFPINKKISPGEVHTLIPACMPYRLPDTTAMMIMQKSSPYFAMIGHGKWSCPELYAGDKSYLLSAGGSNQGKLSQVVARPIVLLLKDSAHLLKDAFHMFGPGKNFMEWNNTGVFKNFACTSGPVHIPSSYTPYATKGEWSVFNITDTTALIIYSSDQFGLMHIVNMKASEQLLKEIILLNPDDALLKKTFKTIDENQIEYDVYARKNKWVIKSYNNLNINRDFHSWKLIETR